MIFTEVHLLPGKLLLVVAMHLLGELPAQLARCQRPQWGAAISTQDKDPQATSNPLEYPFANSRGEESRTPHKNPVWPRTITKSSSTTVTPGFKNKTIYT